MTPVHVIVSDDPGAVDAWKQAFGGAVDVYGFASNVETYERLLAAQAPIDLLVVTDRQTGIFNLGSDQLVDRLGRQPLADNRHIAQMRVVVVGERVGGDVECVGSLEAAVRLVKFGEVEQASAPQASAQPATVASYRPQAGDGLAESVISSMWDGPGYPAEPAAVSPVRTSTPEFRTDVQPLSSAAPQLFIRAPRRAPEQAQGKVAGGGPASASAEVVPIEPQPAAQPHAGVGFGMPGIAVDPLLGWSADAQQRVAASGPSVPAVGPAPAGLAPAAAMQPTAMHPAALQASMPTAPAAAQIVPTMRGGALPISDAPPMAPNYGDATQWPSHPAMPTPQPGIAANAPGHQVPAQAAGPSHAIPEPPVPPAPGAITTSGVATPGGVFDAPHDLLSRLDDDGVNFG